MSIEQTIMVGEVTTENDMKRIIIGVAVFGVLFLTTAVLFSKPAQAGSFGMTGNYKYLLGFQSTESDQDGPKQAMGHGVQIDFLWGLDPKEDGTKISSVALGFDVAGGGIVGDSSGGFYKIAFLSEFNLQNGIGFTAGFGGAHFLIDETPGKYGAPGVHGDVAIWGIGFTDLGVRYSMKNGLIFATSIDLMFDPATAAVAFATPDENDTNSTRDMNQNQDVTFILGVAVGVGYRF